MCINIVQVFLLLLPLHLKILSKEPGFVEKYIEMLKQGCSKKSIDLLKMVDVDLESKDTYKSAIEFYNQKIKELKMLL